MKTKVLICSFLAKTTIHIQLGSDRIKPKSDEHVYNAQLDDGIAGFTLLPTLKEKASMLFHSCKTFLQTFILLYPETQEVSTALA